MFRSLAAGGKIRRLIFSYAKNSVDRLCRQSTPDLPASHPVVAPVAIPAATATFQCPTSAGTQFCALDSRLRDRSSRDVARSDRNRKLGAGATPGIIELDSPADLGCGDDNVPFDGLRLSLVALGHAHGAVFLAIS